MFDKLFEPIQIRGMEIRNRIVMSAMGTHESAESEDGKSVTDKLITYHVARAKGGNGLNTVEVTSVDEASAPHGFLSIAEDKYIPGFKKLNDAVHEAGGKTCVQLWQGGLAVASDQTAQILVPNDLPLSPQYTVPAITNERLLDIIDKFGQAARRAVEAGFDCLEFHCAITIYHIQCFQVELTIEVMSGVDLLKTVRNSHWNVLNPFVPICQRTCHYSCVWIVMMTC